MRAETERRKTEGVAGEWEVVEQLTSNKADDEADDALGSSKKREAGGPPDPEDTRSFKLRKKVAPPVVDDWDIDSIPIKLKPKKTEEIQESTDEVKKEEDSSQHTREPPIKWTSRGWKRPEDEPDEPPCPTTSNDEEMKTKPEHIAAVLKPEAKEEQASVKVEPPTGAVGESGATFRKRKFGGGRGRR